MDLVQRQLNTQQHRLQQVDRSQDANNRQQIPFAMKMFDVHNFPSDYTKNCAELTTAGEWDDVKCSTLK